MHTKNLLSRFFAAVTALILSMVMCAGDIFAVTAEKAGGDVGTDSNACVHLVVENSIWQEEMGAPWSGVLADTYIELCDGDKVGEIVADKLKELGRSAEISADGTKVCIENIKEASAGVDCRWECVVNGIEKNCLADIYRPQGGNLKDGDTLKLSYSGNVESAKADGTDDKEKANAKPDGADGGDNACDITDGASGKTGAEMSGGAENNKASQTDGMCGGADNAEQSADTAGGMILSADTAETAVQPWNAGLTSAHRFSAAQLWQSRAALKDIDAAHESTGGMIASAGIPSVGEAEEWSAIGPARAEVIHEMSAEGYYLNAVNYINGKADKDGRLNPNGPSDNARLVLSLTSIGKNAENISGISLISPLADMSYVRLQGVSGEAWALIALDSNSYRIPKAPAGAEQTTREKLIADIQAEQQADGGWISRAAKESADGGADSGGIAKGAASETIQTAIVLQALAPYYNSNSGVRPTVNKALAFLSSQQDENGRFTSGGRADAQACAQVIIALTSLGINPETDGRFIRNGRSAIDGLLDFYDKNGGFAAFEGESADKAATGAAYSALTAYKRFIGGKTSLYNMTDIFKTEGGENPPQVKPENPENTGNTANNNASRPDRTASGKTVTRTVTRSISVKLGGSVKKAAGLIDALLNPANPADRLPADFSRLTDKQYEAIIGAYREYELLSDDERLLLKNAKQFETVLEKLGALLHCDKDSGIRAENIEWKYKLIIKKKNDFSNELEGMDKALGSEAEVLAFYDISFVDVTTSQKYNPQKPVTIKIPEPDLKNFDSAVIMHIAGGGKQEYIKCEAEDGFLVFKAREFSPYAVIGIKGSWGDVLHDKNDGRAPILWMLAGAFALALLAVLAVLRKRQS